MYTIEELEKMETIEVNDVYGEKKIDADKTRVYLNGNEITVETYVNGYEENYWEVETYKMTKVLNLKTFERQSYSCDSKQAVISAYAMENNLMTQLATGEIYKLDLPILENDNVVSCGDWCAFK